MFAIMRVSRRFHPGVSPVESILAYFDTQDQAEQAMDNIKTNHRGRHEGFGRYTGAEYRIVLAA